MADASYLSGNGILSLSALESALLRSDIPPSYVLRDGKGWMKVTVEIPRGTAANATTNSNHSLRKLAVTSEVDSSLQSGKTLLRSEEMIDGVAEIPSSCTKCPGQGSADVGLRDVCQCVCHGKALCSNVSLTSQQCVNVCGFGRSCEEEQLCGECFSGEKVKRVCLCGRSYLLVDDCFDGNVLQTRLMNACCSRSCFIPLPLQQGDGGLVATRRPLSWTFTLMGPASTYNHDQGLSFFMSGTEAEISRRWSRLLQAAGCSRVAEDGHSSRSKGTRSTEVQRAAASGRKHGQHHQTTKFESEEEFPPLPTGAVLRSTSKQDTPLLSGETRPPGSGSEFCKRAERPSPAFLAIGELGGLLRGSRMVQQKSLAVERDEKDEKGIREDDRSVDGAVFERSVAKYIGYDYFCEKGHRFILQPDMLLRTEDRGVQTREKKGSGALKHSEKSSHGERKPQITKFSMRKERITRRQLAEGLSTGACEVPLYIYCPTGQGSHVARLERVYIVSGDAGIQVQPKVVLQMEGSLPLTGGSAVGVPRSKVIECGSMLYIPSHSFVCIALPAAYMDRDGSCIVSERSGVSGDHYLSPLLPVEGDSL